MVLQAFLSFTFNPMITLFLHQSRPILIAQFANEMNVQDMKELSRQLHVVKDMFEEKLILIVHVGKNTSIVEKEVPIASSQLIKSSSVFLQKAITVELYGIQKMFFRIFSSLLPSKNKALNEYYDRLEEVQNQYHFTFPGDFKQLN